MSHKNYIINRRQQKGVVLAIALIMLVMITLLAISGMRSTVMEERMAGNSRNSNTAFQLAESALREGEQILQTTPAALNTGLAQANNIGIGCVVSLDTLDFSLPATWAAAPCDMLGDISELGTRQLPQYYIEFVFAQPPVMMAGGVPLRDCFYQITSRGYGADANSFVTLQSTYKFDICT